MNIIAKCPYCGRPAHFGASGWWYCPHCKFGRWRFEGVKTGRYKPPHVDKEDSVLHQFGDEVSPHAIRTLDTHAEYPITDLKLQVYVVIGLFGTAAITKAEPRDFWEREVQMVGAGLDDLGIPNVPTEPGWYRWYGTVREEKAKGPGLKGGYESVYKGEWVKMLGAAP